MDPAKLLNLAAGHSLISDSLVARLIKNLLFDRNSLATTGDNPRRWYGVMSPSIEEFRYDKDHDGKGPFRSQKSAQWALFMIYDS